MKLVNNHHNDEPIWLTAARRELGQREKAGPAENGRILWYHSFSKLRAQSEQVPWCASFVNAMLETSGIRSTKSAAAASYATWGEPCELKDGAIVVFGKADPDAGGTGHVAFCVGVEDRYVLVLGGNQNNAVNIARRERSRIVAVRWPVNT
jgi:uncharacterized protein (TIGR02594 family)